MLCEGCTPGEEVIMVDAGTTEVFGADVPFFTMQVIGLRGVTNSDQHPAHMILSRELDCYVDITVSDKLIGTTNLIADSAQPMFPKEFDITEFSEGDILEFKVYAKGGAGANYVGGVTMDAEQFATHGFNNYVMLKETGDNMQAYLGFKIKPGGIPYLPDPATTFTVEVEKGEYERYGMLLDYSDCKTFVLHGLVAGPFVDYNKSAEPSQQLIRTDFIVSVNDETTLNGIHRQFEEASVTCVVMRSHTFFFTLEREDIAKPVGMSFPEKLKEQGYGLPILGISATEGAAKEYNDKCDKECDKLKAYDRIVRIDGETGLPSDLQEKIENATGKFQIQILRPPLLETQAFL